MTSRTDSPSSRTAASQTLRQEDLLSPFVSRDPVCERVGLELEKFGVFENGLSLPVTGPRSIRSILERLEKDRHWKAERDGDSIIALRRSGQVISVEPGGQLELSTPPACLIDEAYRAEREHLDELQQISGGWGVTWCGAGVRPYDTLDSVGWIPKKRYMVMRDHLAKTGKLAHWMMKMTASLQVSVDYVSEPDAALKLNVLARLTPVLTAICAASPVALGKRTGFASYRAHIWTKTDPARCGLPDCFFKPDFKFDDYVKYAMGVPLFFIERQGRVIPTGRLTFAAFMREGYCEHEVTIEDWNRHLTFLFPEIRLKSYIEVRSCDRQPGTRSFATAALIKSLIYSKATLQQANQWLAKITAAQAREGLAEAAKDGLQGKYAGRPLRAWADEALALGKSGLGLLKAAERASDMEGLWMSDLNSEIRGKRPSTTDAILKAFDAKEPLSRVVRL